MADKTYKLEFTLSDGSKINAGNIVAQQGEKGNTGATGDTGEKGNPGVSVTGATLTEVTT